ncbi:SDR family oxidoreductase [Microbacterium koreense]|uniref:SDR family oxidoreductase n=1 Tax=Microbacterium koreense TaxID=323761 RepID=A0ABW2ZPH9_9MICO
MRIAVAGGTGISGQHVVAAARARDHEVVVLARSTGIDLLSGAGVERALRGVDAVIDMSNPSSTETPDAVSFFAGVTHTLLTAGHRAGVAHHIAVSIVGIDAAPEGYYAGKLTQERLIAEGAVPWTIQRSTQFHEFAAQMFARATVAGIHLAPRGRVQPIAAHELATHLVRRAEEGPQGRARDLAGPREESLAEMVRSYARAIGHRMPLPAISVPGAIGRAQRSGALLPSGDSLLGTQTFTEWLQALPDA